MMAGFCAMEFRFMYGESCEGAQSGICQQPAGISAVAEDSSQGDELSCILP